MWCRRTYEFDGAQHGLVEILPGYDPYEFRVNRFHLVFERKDRPYDPAEPNRAKCSFITCDVVSEARRRGQDGLPEELISLAKVTANDIPAGLRCSIARRAEEMDALVASAVRFFAWRSNLARAYVDRGKALHLEISLDGYEWVSYEPRRSAQNGHRPARKIADRNEHGIGVAFERGEREPLHHRLFCEAAEMRRDNACASLVIGLTAAEIALKHLIVWDEPAMSWVIITLPLSDLIQVSAEYIPNLIARRKVEGLMVNEQLFSEVALAQRERDRAAHGSLSRISDRVMKKHLHAISNLLRVVDVCMGCSWAASYIDSEYYSGTPRFCQGETVEA